MRLVALILIAIFFGGCTSPQVSDAVRVKGLAAPVLPDVSEPVPPPAPVEQTVPQAFEWRPSSDAGPWRTNGTVEIPSQGRVAPIVRVGIGKNGQMVIPRNAADVAWLDQGQFASPTNNLILAGHVSYRGVKGAFHHIGALEVGDPVVATMDGRRWEYRVEWKELVDKDTERAAELLGPLGVQSVTLITCGGTFSQKLRTHTDRWIVRGTLVSTTMT